MWNVLALALTCLLVLVAPARAQQTPPADAAASAAMERARRQAAGPMRVIIEASKSRRRVQEPEVPDSTDQPRRGPPRVAAVPAEPGVVSPRSVAPAGAAVAASAAAPAAAAAGTAGADADGSTPGATDGAITTEITLSSNELQRRADNVAAPALEAATPSAPLVLPLPAATAALPVLLEVKPKLVSMVDPVVTPAMLDGVRRDVGVSADLTIRADGTVASVAVLPPASRLLVRAMVTALEQWRFEPLPGERKHRVQLVFNE